MAQRAVDQLFREQVLRRPDAVAVIAGDTSLTYARLAARVERLADHLAALGIGPGTLVAVRVERGVDLPVALLAVLAAGAAYLPLDPALPAARTEFMLADAGVRFAVADEVGAANLPAGITVVPVGAAPTVTSRRAVPRSPLDRAYVIYTSGSTGRPKGVVIPHRALTNFLDSMLERPGIGPDAILVAVTTVSFDIAALELFLPLLVGARLVIARREECSDPLELAALLADTGATVMQATPSTWRILRDSGWSPPAGFSALCGGEKLPVDLAGFLGDSPAGAWDLYGPTETTVWSAAGRLGAAGRVVDWAPVRNTTIEILDGELSRTPPEEVGEVYIGGAGLADGYLGRAGLTAERFVPAPGGAAGERLYRTGDLARRDRRGVVEILGRTDHQVKIRGFRIELGEIENALLGHEAIGQAVVVAHGTDTGTPRLVAYLVAPPRDRP